MDSKRQNISTGSVWEATVGYSRAVKIGNIIEVSGTVASSDDGTVGLNDVYAQTKFTIQKIEKALNEAGATLADVVRTRVFVTNIADWQDVGRAHGEFFGDIRPCTTMVEVARLINDEYLVEIEATAIVQ
jgi:enamine deaminase RidA (YjgF/YER057c/UK114 family)